MNSLCHQDLFKEKSSKEKGTLQWKVSESVNAVGIQYCLLLYLAPVRDEEAESQRKAKSRHARQTRRSTQGVTLTDLKEAQKTNSLSSHDRQTEDSGTLEDRVYLKKGLTETEISPKWSKFDEQGNIEPRLETLTESPITNLSYSSIAGSCGLSYCNISFKVDNFSPQCRVRPQQSPWQAATESCQRERGVAKGRRGEGGRAVKGEGEREGKPEKEGDGE
ncbi:hypothetical protein Q5P01_007964 [Channa striata]|uniref:Uncharacterized protein n=1 Tax=Channa striata TaxID=64152 RepID=A0AA88N5R3_CHASR|nr:hypothetical protein Q5P01_007964 [Channa striata]